MFAAKMIRELCEWHSGGPAHRAWSASSDFDGSVIIALKDGLKGIEVRATAKEMREAYVDLLEILTYRAICAMEGCE